MEGPKLRQIKTICVFCGSKVGKGFGYLETAVDLGKKFGEKGITLVYGGGSSGLMGCVSQAALKEKARVIGVIPVPLVDIAGKTRGHEVQTLSIHERITCMLYGSDAFIALPGGFGTLEEIFNITSWAQLDLHTKPIGLLNINNFFDGLITFLDYAVEQGFISPFSRRILISAPTIDELLDKLHSYIPIQDPAGVKIDWSQGRGIKRNRSPVNVNLTL